MFESANIPQQPLGFSPANQVSNIRVEKLLMFETGTYYPQHRRPYVADTGGQCGCAPGKGGGKWPGQDYG
jgi:hypothetical protein